MIALYKYLKDCTAVLKDSVNEDFVIEYIKHIVQGRGKYKSLRVRIVNDIGKRYYKSWLKLSEEDYTSLTDNKLTSLYTLAFKDAFPRAWELVVKHSQV